MDNEIQKEFTNKMFMLFLDAYAALIVENDNLTSKLKFAEDRLGYRDDTIKELTAEIETLKARANE